MTTEPAPARSVVPYRVAAVLVLAGGAAAALWVDPALLDDLRVKFGLAGMFALLWLVPHFQALRQRSVAAKRARAAAAIVTTDADPEAGRRWLDTLLGMLAGVLGGALVLSVPGAVAALSSGPRWVGKVFDLIGPYGLLAVVLLAVTLRYVMALVIGSTMRAIRASRFVGGLVIGLYLWVPFHATLAQLFGQIGFDLPGLEVSDVGVRQ